EGHPLAAHDLLALEPEGALVDDLVHHAVDDGGVVGVPEGEERLGHGVDAELLLQLACRTRVEGLAGREHAADPDGPAPPADVLRRRPEMHEEGPAATEDD